MPHLCALNREHHRFEQISYLSFILSVAHISISFCFVSGSSRINIGQQYQAEIPDLKDQLSSHLDQHKAELVWLPLNNPNQKQSDEETSRFLSQTNFSHF